MAEVNEQIAQIKANSTAMRSTAIRAVQGGYVVTAQTQYASKATKAVEFSEAAEGVAASANAACQMSLNYHTAGNFDGTVEASQADLQANLFQSAPSAI